MELVTIILIAATVIISLKGFNDPYFTDQYLFRISDVKNKKQYIRLITSGFLHADLPHLLFNMMTLYFFSSIGIQYFGDMGFILIYLFSIVVGNLFSMYLYKNQPYYAALGASGGVSGVLFTAIALDPHIGIGFMFIPIPISGYIFGFLYFAYSIYQMMNPKSTDNIGHSAHLGGAIVGIIAVFVAFPSISFENSFYVGIMSLPLLYLVYMIIQNKI